VCTEPLGVHITVKELKELMELLRGFLEESPLMVSVNRLEGFTDNPRVPYLCTMALCVWCVCVCVC
jgi:hypothetical protein